MNMLIVILRSFPTVSISICNLHMHNIIEQRVEIESQLFKNFVNSWSCWFRVNFFFTTLGEAVVDRPVRKFVCSAASESGKLLYSILYSFSYVILL